MGERAEIDALEGLYRSRYRWFLRIAWLIAGSEELAHEAVQEGFAGALRSRSSFRGEGTLEAWVWRGVVNAAKKQRRDRTVPAADLEPVAHLNGDEGEFRAIRTWIAALPERQRLVVFLRYYADLDYRTIADVLEIEIGTVSATLNKAHRGMRQLSEEVPK